MKIQKFLRTTLVVIEFIRLVFFCRGTHRITGSGLKTDEPVNFSSEHKVTNRGKIRATVCGVIRGHFYEERPQLILCCHSFMNVNSLRGLLVEQRKILQSGVNVNPVNPTTKN